MKICWRENSTLESINYNHDRFLIEKFVYSFCLVLLWIWWEIRCKAIIILLYYDIFVWIVFLSNQFVSFILSVPHINVIHIYTVNIYFLHKSVVYTFWIYPLIFIAARLTYYFFERKTNKYFNANTLRRLIVLSAIEIQYESCF